MAAITASTYYVGERIVISNDLMHCQECGKLCGDERHTYVHCLEYKWDRGNSYLTNKEMRSLIACAHIGIDYRLWQLHMDNRGTVNP